MKNLAISGLLVAIVAGCAPTGGLTSDPSGIPLRDQLANRTLVSSSAGTWALRGDGTYTVQAGAVQDYGTWTAADSTLCVVPNAITNPTQVRSCYGVSFQGSAVSLRSHITHEALSFRIQ